MKSEIAQSFTCELKIKDKNISTVGKIRGRHPRELTISPAVHFVFHQGKEIPC